MKAAAALTVKRWAQDDPTQVVAPRGYRADAYVDAD